MPARTRSLVGEATASAQRFTTSDHLQSTRDVVLNGSVEGRAEFDPWGRPTVIGTITVASTFAGQQRYLDTPLNLTMYRQYNPESAGWLSEDPAGAVDGPNLRAYVRNNPVRLNDPLGLCGCDDECPSGNWDVSYNSITFGIGIGMDAGFGRIMCRERPTISRSAKVGCVLLGFFATIALSGAGTAGPPAISGPCNRSELTATRTTSWVGMTPVGSLSVDKGKVSGFGASLGPGGGFAFSDCMITPQ